nr:MAG: hypothetical protein DIU74_10075 [Pseudomonadota bacterium]
MWGCCALFLGHPHFRALRRFPRWAHARKPWWGFSSRRFERVPPGVTVVNETPAQLLARLESRWLKRAWLTGGGKLAASFAAQGLIREYVVSIMPVLLGRGVPLLDGISMPEELNLVDARRFANGVMQLRYSAG